MSRQRSSAPFTLLEIVISMAVLSCIGVLALYKGHDFYRERAFSTSCQRLKEEITLSKSLALNFAIDVDLELVETKKGVFLIRTTDVAPIVVQHLFKKEIRLPYLALEEERKEATLHFYSSGGKKIPYPIKIKDNYGKGRTLIMESSS